MADWLKRGDLAEESIALCVANTVIMAGDVVTTAVGTEGDMDGVVDGDRHQLIHLGCLHHPSMDSAQMPLPGLFLQN